MVKTPHEERFIQRSTLPELNDLLGRIADELRLRACLSGDLDHSERGRLLLKATARVVEARTYLRAAPDTGHGQLREPPAVPVSDVPHGAAQPEAPRLPVSTTTGAAGTCARCGHSEKAHELHHSGRCAGGGDDCECRAFVAHVDYRCPRCEEDLGHEGECRPPPGPETAATSPSPSELQRRGPRGPEAAEGAGEAGRAKTGPVDLAHHLALLKGGAA